MNRTILKRMRAAVGVGLALTLAMPVALANQDRSFMMRDGTAIYGRYFTSVTLAEDEFGRAVHNARAKEPNHVEHDAQIEFPVDNRFRGMRAGERVWGVVDKRTRELALYVYQDPAYNDPTVPDAWEFNKDLGETERHWLVSGALTVLGMLLLL